MHRFVSLLRLHKGRPSSLLPDTCTPALIQFAGVCLEGGASCAQGPPPPSQHCSPGLWLQGCSTGQCRHLSTRATPGHRFTDDYDRGYDKHHRVNTDIFSRALNVVFPDGHVSKLSRRDALKAANQLGLDLVEFRSAVSSDPPLAKLVHYWQLKEERRKEHQTAVEQLKAARPLESEASTSSSRGEGAAEQGQPTGARSPFEELRESIEKGRQAGMADAYMQSTLDSAHSAQGSGVPISHSSSESPHTADVHTSEGEQGASRVRRTSLFDGGGGGDEHAEGSHSLRESGAEAQTSGRERSSSAASASGRPGDASKAKKKGSQQQQDGKKKKVKEVFFGPKIAHHDIEVRLKKARQWLSDGLKVSVAQEIDSIDSKSAAELALDSITAKLAEYGRPATGKHSSKSVVSLVLQPREKPGEGTAAAAASPGSEAGSGKKRKQEAAQQ